MPVARLPMQSAWLGSKRMKTVRPRYLRDNPVFWAYFSLGLLYRVVFRYI
jgi:hypothetical protein